MSDYPNISLWSLLVWRNKYAGCKLAVTATQTGFLVIVYNEQVTRML